MIRLFQGAGLARRRSSNTNTPHAYWRIFFTNGHGAAYLAVAEIEMRATAGGADQLTGGTILYSTQAAGAAASEAFDNDLNNCWNSNGVNTNQYLGYQFASPVNVEEVMIRTPVNGSQGAIEAVPKDCIVQYSDNGTTWFDHFSFSIYWAVFGQSRVYPEAANAAGYHRAWRIFCVDNNGHGSWMSLQEVEFRASAGGSDQTANVGSGGSSSGRIIYSSSTGGGNEFYRAFNDALNNDNHWIGQPNNNQYIGFVFPNAVKVEEIRLDGVRSWASGSEPKNMRIEYSDDEVTWTSQKSIGPYTGWTTNETKVITAI